MLRALLPTFTRSDSKWLNPNRLASFFATDENFSFVDSILCGVVGLSHILSSDLPVFIVGGGMSPNEAVSGVQLQEKRKKLCTRLSKSFSTGSAPLRTASVWFLSASSSSSLRFLCTKAE